VPATKRHLDDSQPRQRRRGGGFADLEREPLDDRGLADAGLADEQGVVLLRLHQHAGEPPGFVLPPHGANELSRAPEGREVAAELHRVPGRRRGRRRHGRACERRAIAGLDDGRRRRSTQRAKELVARHLKLRQELLDGARRIHQHRVHQDEEIDLVHREAVGLRKDPTAARRPVPREGVPFAMPFAPDGAEPATRRCGLQSAGAQRGAEGGALRFQLRELGRFHGQLLAELVGRVVEARHLARPEKKVLQVDVGARELLRLECAKGERGPRAEAEGGHYAASGPVT
jgi:hypothetical protein